MLGLTAMQEAIARRLISQNHRESSGNIGQVGTARKLGWIGLLARRHLSDGGLVLYDVTSTYFEGPTCPSAKFAG